MLAFNTAHTHALNLLQRAKQGVEIVIKICTNVADRVFWLIGWASLQGGRDDRHYERVQEN